MAQPETPRSPAQATGTGTQYLSFRIGTEEYAIEILGVQEIRGFTTITPIPNAPDYIKGVINLRGTVVPVIGLRERFGIPSVAYDKFTVIVIVSLEPRIVGVVVDAVTDVLTLKERDLDAPPELGGQVDTSFIRGLAKTEERLVVVLDLQKALRDPLVGATDSPSRLERAAS